MIYNSKYLTCNFSGRLGNHVFRIYKVFYYAFYHKIPFKYIIFDKQYYNDFFSNIKQHFIENVPIDKNIKNIFEVSKDTLENTPFDTSISINDYNFFYPESSYELSLFNYCFSNKAIKLNVLNNCINNGFFKKTTVGISIRRGDFLNEPNKFLILDAQTIKNIFKDYYARYNNPTFIITSDDIAYIKNILNNEKYDIIYINNYQIYEIIYILSLCDIVNANGVEFTARIINNKFVSTFCYIPLCLHKSYKYEKLIDQFFKNYI